jgi:uncharacterized membrane protein
MAMEDRDLLGIAATAKLAGHPIHPMLIPFPIALLVATFATDLAYWSSLNPFWAQVSFWSLAAALLMAALAATAGLIDFFSNARIRALSDAWRHMIGNVIAVLLSILNFWIRLSQNAAEAVLPWGLTLSSVIVLLLLYTGWKGGDLVYRHRIGMHPEAPSGSSS